MCSDPKCHCRVLGFCGPAWWSDPNPDRQEELEGLARRAFEHCVRMCEKEQLELKESQDENSSS